jgi:hypothetical protein
MVSAADPLRSLISFFYTGSYSNVFLFLILRLLLRAAPDEASNVFVCSNTTVVGSHPPPETWMYVRTSSAFVFSCIGI